MTATARVIMPQPTLLPEPHTDEDRCILDISLSQAQELVNICINGLRWADFGDGDGVTPADIFHALNRVGIRCSHRVVFAGYAPTT